MLPVDIQVRERGGGGDAVGGQAAGDEGIRHGWWIMSLLYMIYKFLPDKIIYIIVCKIKEHGLENPTASAGALHQHKINSKRVLGTYTIFLRRELLRLMSMGASHRSYLPGGDHMRDWYHIELCRLLIRVCERLYQNMRGRYHINVRVDCSTSPIFLYKDTNRKRCVEICSSNPSEFGLDSNNTCVQCMSFSYGRLSLPHLCR